MKSRTLYHKCLHVSVTLVAGLLVFQSSFMPFQDLDVIEHSRLLVANVIGISAGVTPTELNTMTAEITKRSTDLDRREADLREREIAAQAATSTSFPVSEYVLSAILLLLLVLITLNYLFDFLRARKAISQTYVQVS